MSPCGGGFAKLLTKGSELVIDAIHIRHIYLLVRIYMELSQFGSYIVDMVSANIDGRRMKVDSVRITV